LSAIAGLQGNTKRFYFLALFNFLSLAGALRAGKIAISGCCEPVFRGLWRWALMSLKTS
jgi:hypothetical protein